MERAWNVGEQIEFEVESSLFEGIYLSHIMGLNSREGILHIEFPHSDGKLVLLPVGSLVRVRLDRDQQSQLYSVIDRTSGSNRCLVLQLVNNEFNRLIHLAAKKSIEIYSVCSGKGGVGKTTFAINLGVTLRKQGKRVCIFDAALGTANVDVLLDVTPRYNLVHVISGECSMLEILTETAEGICLIPGCSGVQRLTDMTDYQYNYLASELESVLDYFDVLIIDTGAGIARTVTNFILASHTGFLLTTPEPHSITDSYALLKTLVREQIYPLKLNLIVNQVNTKSEAEDTAEKLLFSAKKFLNFELHYLGYIPNDYRMIEAIANQKSIVRFESTAMSSIAYEKIVNNLISKDENIIREQGNVTKLMTKLKSIGKRA